MFNSLILSIVPNIFIRTDYYKNIWRKKREIIKRRDKNKCRVCGSLKQIEVHHLNDKSNYPSLSLRTSNLICLCKKCHTSFHSWNGGFAKECTDNDFYKWAVSKNTL